METIIVIQFLLIAILFYKVRKLTRILTTLDFLENNINKLLINKKIIKNSEIEIMANESIGNMPELDGNRIIKYAKSIGITIPEFMNDEELKKYVEKQEIKRRNNEISFTDRMVMEEND